MISEIDVQMIDPKNKCIVHVSTGITPTSMSYGDFAVYMAEHRPRIKVYYLNLFETKISHQVPYPENLQIFRCGVSIHGVRKALRFILRGCAEEGTAAVFHIHEAKTAVFFYCATFGRFKRQTVYTIHSTFSNYRFRTKVLATLASLMSNKVVCVSQTSYRHYPAWLKRILKNRIICIQNGVDCERINRVLAEMPAKHQIVDSAVSSRKTRLVYVARLIPLKQQGILIQTMAELPTCELTLIGDGEQKKNLQALSNKYHVADRIHFIGIISREDVYAQIKTHDIYVTSSSYEGLPISLLEAMSCGVVCLASDIEQHREIQEKCPSLITVKNTAEEWRRAIRSVIDMSTEEKQTIALKNKRDVDLFFSLEQMHAQYDRVYEEIIEGECQ